MPVTFKERIAKFEVALRNIGQSETADDLADIALELADAGPLPWRLVRRSTCAALRVLAKIPQDETHPRCYEIAAKRFARVRARMANLKDLHEHIVRVEPDDHERLDEVIELALTAFGDSGPVSYGRTRRQYFEDLSAPMDFDLPAVSPFQLLAPRLSGTDRPTRLAPVGYTSVIPLSSETARRWLDGELSQYEWDKYSIDHNATRDGASTIYLQAAYVEGPHRERFGTLLLFSLLFSVVRFLPRNWDPKSHSVVIAAEQFHDLTADVLGAFGCTSEHESKDNNKIWTVDLHAAALKDDRSLALIKVMKSVQNAREQLLKLNDDDDVMPNIDSTHAA